MDQVVALAVKLVQKMSIAVTAFGKTRRSVGPGFIIDRIAVVVLPALSRPESSLVLESRRSVSILKSGPVAIVQSIDT